MRKNESATPTLDTYAQLAAYRPDRPEVRRWIFPELTLIINNSCAPGAKIDVLSFAAREEDAEKGGKE